MSAQSVAPQRVGPLWQQQVLALDAKYNTLRAANQSTLGSYRKQAKNHYCMKENRNI